MINNIVFFTLLAVGISAFSLVFIFSIGKISLLDGIEGVTDEKRIFSFIGKYVFTNFCPICFNLEILSIFFVITWLVYDLQYKDLIYYFNFLGIGHGSFAILKNYV